MNSDVRPGFVRKYVDGEDVSLGDLETAFREAARLVVEEGDEFLPLFERIEKEKERRREKNAALDRASAAASGGDPSGSSNLDPSK